MDLNWFQLGPLPANIMTGTYNPLLVILSYIIAVLASYVALDLVGRLREEKNPHSKIYWLLGGAFAMGAGIWSMHFIGMLAFIMPMPMSYNIFWTVASLITAMLASGFALYILRTERTVRDLIFSGILIGLGIATMHYMGMYAMTHHVHIRYLPGLFFLSIAIAIFASEAALWLALRSNKETGRRQFNLKIISALVMGIAICGMHYTGMAAAVFTPLHAMEMEPSIRPELLAFFVAGITALIISLALTVSTYYKRLVNAVQNEKEFLNAMLNNLEDGIIACDSKGDITVLNDALLKNINLTFYRPRNIAQLAEAYDLYFPSEKKLVAQDEYPLRRALNGERIHGLELIIQFKNGIERNVVIDGQPIINANGTKLGAVIVVHDVTEIKQTEKMKSEFVSVVSHELRTPLTSIRGSLGLLLGGAAGNFTDKASKLLDIANKNCERLLLLINDILDMEKIQAGKMKFDLRICDLEELVKEAIDANRSYADKFNVSIKLVKSVERASVYLDPDRLLQVLANLISNAAKFSPANEEIRIKIEKLSSKKIRVSICDHGAGIPEEFQPRIFQKFSQADSSDTRGKGGTGLGLSISKAIIEKIGGTLNFISNSKQGTIFYFDLPVYSFAAETSTKNTPETISYEKHKRVLICEDDYQQSKYIYELLSGSRIEADVAHSAAKARQWLQDKTYDAILLDLILPDEDGITFIRELRQNPKTKDIPLVVLSVVTQSGKELLNGDALFVVDWLDKPINREKLLDAVDRLKLRHLHTLPQILHVEDDIDTQHIIHSLLENAAEVTTCPSIKKAIQELGHKHFDLVVLDLMLPDGNGADLLPIFAKYKLPIIVYSAFDLDREYSHYVTQSLIKSKISNDELLALIKKLLEEPIKDTGYVD